MVNNILMRPLSILHLFDDLPRLPHDCPIPLVFFQLSGDKRLNLPPAADLRSKLRPNPVW